MQMIHWFTGNRKYESLETIELLNCIMNSLVDDKDAALRDFAATCLKEFLKWSIKHTPLDKQNASITPSPVNVKSILKRIFNFLTHPSSSKRLGAALAWNSIYVIFREEDSLIDKHIFELLYYLIESLTLAEKDDKFLGTQEQSKLGLDHVERIIKTKSVILNSKNPDRVKPPGWAEAILEVAVRWLMRQCGRIEAECRHKSMELAYNLAPFIDGIKDNKMYFKIKLERETELYFLARFEGSLEKKDILKDSLCNYQILTDLSSDQFQLNLVITWLSMLTAPLDCYSWVFGANLLTPSNIFSSGKSCIWTSIKYFIENIANFDLADLIKHIYHKNKLIVCTPHEIEEYRKAKCTVIIRLIDFLCVLMGNHSRESLQFIPSDLFSEHFFTCIINICLDPQQVGFNLNDLEVYTNLPTKTKDFFVLANKFLHQDIQDRLKLVCKKLINEKKQFQTLIDEIKAIKQKLSKADTMSDSILDNSINLSSSNTDWLKLSQLVTGFEQLSEFDLYEISFDINRIIFDYIIVQSESRSSFFVQESLTCIDAKRKLLNLSINLNYISIKKTNNLNDDYLIEILDKYLLTTAENKIFTFFANYKNTICDWICKRYDYTLKYILNKVNIAQHIFINSVNLLTSLLEYLVSDKQNKKAYGTKIVKIIYENWSLFTNYWYPVDSLLENKTSLINLLCKSISIESIQFSNESSKVISEMYMLMLIDSKMKLNFKSRLLDLLCFFCEPSKECKISEYLPQFLIQFPLRSTQLVKGEDTYNDYVNSIRKMLIALELSLSTDLLENIVNIYCRESDHICDEEIQTSLIRFIKRNESSKQLAVINDYWNIYFKKHDILIDERNRRFQIFQKVLVTFLTNCDKPTFLEFMCSNIMNLMTILDSDLKESTYDLVSVNKKHAFELIEIAYKRLHKDEIFYPNAKICQTYETSRFKEVKDGKELTKEVLRKSRKYLCEDFNFTASLDADTRERYIGLQRKLHCAAYNCLVSLFIRTQTEIKFYQAFLFKDDEKKVLILNLFQFFAKIF
jgi:DNA-dependent protein kinase catalytic subunit